MGMGVEKLDIDNVVKCVYFRGISGLEWIVSPKILEVASSGKLVFCIGSSTTMLVAIPF